MLGVGDDASPDAVRQAWRMWARIAHPDAGGDPRHFAQIDQARRVLLHATASPRLAPPGSTNPANPARPRPALRAVLTKVRHPRSLALAAGASIVSALLPAVTDTPLALAALPAALTATAWAVWATRETVTDRGDRGHRIEVLALFWLPLALAQVLVSSMAGASLIPVLPLLALPLAAAVASMNPGAGLWRTNQSARIPDGSR